MVLRVLTACEAAREEGLDVVLTGEDGDGLLGGGPVVLAHLLTTGRLPSLAREAAAIRRVSGFGGRKIALRTLDAAGLSARRVRRARPTRWCPTPCARPTVSRGLRSAEGVDVGSGRATCRGTSTVVTCRVLRRRTGFRRSSWDGRTRPGWARHSSSHAVDQLSGPDHRGLRDASTSSPVALSVQGWQESPGRACLVGARLRRVPGGDGVRLRPLGGRFRIKGIGGGSAGSALRREWVSRCNTRSQAWKCWVRFTS